MKKILISVLLILALALPAHGEIVGNRVGETTTTTGTGDYNLAGARAKYQSFIDGIGDGEQCRYVAWEEVDTNENGVLDWEVGLGTVTQVEVFVYLSRDEIEESSNSGAAVNWGTGTKYVHQTVTADFYNSVLAGSTLDPEDYMLKSNIGMGAGNYLQLSEAPGTPDGSKFLRDDMTWASSEGAGDMTKAVYDVDSNNVVDEAEAITGQGGMATTNDAPTDGTGYVRKDGAWAAETEGVETESDPIVGAVSGIIKADGAGNISAATAGVDYITTDSDTTYSAGTGLDLTSTTFSLSHLGFEALADPGADHFIMWDDTAGGLAWDAGITQLDELADVSGYGNAGYILKDDGDETYSFINSISISSFTVPYGTDTAPTSEGQIYWNSSEDTLTVGDGASAVTIGGGSGAGIDMTLGPPNAQSGNNIVIPCDISPADNYLVRVWVSDTDGGVVASEAPDGGTTAADGFRVTNGTEFEEHTAELDYSILSGATGEFSITLDDDDEDNTYYLCAYLNGLVDCAGPIAWDHSSPTLQSATIGTNGTTWTLEFSENIDIGSGGSGGWSGDMSTSGAVALTYSSGDGSDTFIYTGDKTVQSGETGTIDYTQPGDGLEDDQGNDLASITDGTVTNNSTQGGGSTYYYAGDGTWEGNGGVAYGFPVAGAVSVSSSGTATELGVYIHDVTGTVNLKLALYDTSGNFITSGTVSSATTGWNDATISQAVTAQTYHVWWRHDDSGNAIDGAWDTGSDGRWAEVDYSSSWPDPISSSNDGSKNHAVRILVE